MKQRKHQDQSVGGVVTNTAFPHGEPGSEALYVNGVPVHIHIVQHDTTRDYLSDARQKVVNAIADIRLATLDANTFASQVALDALNDALTAIEAETEARDDGRK